MTADLLDLIEARERRDHGLSLVEESEPSAWQRDALLAITGLAMSGREFSSDVVCQMVGRRPLHCNAVGALMKRAVVSLDLECVGRVQSGRRDARARWLPLYRKRQQ